MSSHNIYISCTRCKKTEAVYTGDVSTDEFDDSDWEGGFIYTDCIACKVDAERKRNEYRAKAWNDPHDVDVDTADWPALGLCGFCGKPATGHAPNSMGFATTACAEHERPTPVG